MTLKRPDAKKVGLYHWPWSWIRTQAYLIKIEESVEDREQLVLLNEFHRFLLHPSTGVESFDQMPKEWKLLIGSIRDKASLKKNAPEVEHLQVAVPPLHWLL